MILIDSLIASPNCRLYLFLSFEHKELDSQNHRIRAYSLVQINNARNKNYQVCIKAIMLHI